MVVGHDGLDTDLDRLVLPACAFWLSFVAERGGWCSDHCAADVPFSGGSERLALCDSVQHFDRYCAGITGAQRAVRGLVWLERRNHAGAMVLGFDCADDGSGRLLVAQFRLYHLRHAVGAKESVAALGQGFQDRCRSGLEWHAGIGWLATDAARRRLGDKLATLGVGNHDHVNGLEDTDTHAVAACGRCNGGCFDDARGVKFGASGVACLCIGLCACLSMGDLHG